MRKRRLKKKVKIFGIIIIVLIVFIIILVKVLTFLNSYEHKLDTQGYSKEETTIIMKLKDDEIDNILKLDYNKNISKLLQEKYFMYKNLNRYLEYYKKNSNLNARNVVELVNVNRDKEYYTNIKSTDITKDASMLVNKYYGLNKEYRPVDLQTMSLTYSYSGNSLLKEANQKFIELINAAKKLKYNIIASSSFRTYESQENIYNKDEKLNGKDKTDLLVARPGHSEHQLGLALDIDLYKKKYEKLEDTEEYTWLVDNAHTYGYILRYPKDKENITGYKFEPWHYRYVGIDIANYIYKNKITFDEYYSFYIEK
jgi:D-alanyl-D-alanine carboxypeptidase